MKKFRIAVCGKNFLIQDAEEASPRKLGFLTVVFVEAPDSKIAESKALQIIRDDALLKNLVLNKKTDPPVLIVEPGEELASFQGCKMPRAGLIFYPEEPAT